MKNIILIIATIFLAGFQQNLFAQSATQDNFTVQVDGLGCPFCAYGLEKKFKELKGIKKVAIEMETGMMTFLYPTDKKLAIVDVEKQVEKAGYTPVSVAVTRADGTTEKSETNTTTIATTDEVSETSFFVAGNCGMCEARIEKAANKVTGVTEADWDKDTKQLTVKFATAQTSEKAIAKAVATAGHDTKTAKANSDTYDNLPGCCQYERVQ